MTTDKHVERWVYGGRIILRGGKLGYMYASETDMGCCYYFEKSLSGGSRSGVIGGIYEGYVYDLEGQVRIAQGWKYIGRIADSDWTAEREAKSIAEEASYRHSQQEKADRVDREIMRRIDPIRAVYWSTNETGRRAIIAEIIEYLGRRPR